MSWALLAALIFAEPPLRTPPVLLGDPPRAEAAAGRRDMLDVVRLQLTLDEQGGPTEVVVFTSTTDDPAVLEAALAVGRTLRFQPATDGGEPIAARIRVQVEVGSSPAWAGRDRRPLEAPPPPPVAGDGEVLGRVLERGTRRPLPGLPVTLPELGRIETTDAAGRFRFEGLPKRPLRLEIPALDHEAVAEEITAGGEERVFRLERAPNARYESVVEAPTSDASAIRIPVSVAREVPGSSGDPVKVVEVLPGVARPAAAGPGAGQLSIRGSAPEDTRFYIDGMPVYQVFHFGGLYSVLQDEWIGDIDYRPGGFSVEYGEATGGLLGIGFAPIPDDGVHGNVDLNIYHASALATGAVSEDWTIGGAVRRSWFDLIVPAVAGDAINFVAAPRYYDYQARADYRPNADVALRLAVFGSDDTLALLTDAPSDSDPNSRGFELSRAFHQIQAVADLRLTRDVSLFAGISTSYQTLSLSPTVDTRLNITFDPVTARSNVVWQALPNVAVRGGFWTTATRFKIDALIPRPVKEGQASQPTSTREPLASDETGIGTENAIYAEVEVEPLDRFDIIAGARLSGWTGNFDRVAVDPRLLLRYGWDSGTTLTAAVGWYHQAPSAEESSESFGNTDLSPEHALQTSLGVKQLIGDYLTLEVTGFYKLLGDLITVGDFGGPRYTNEGEGTVFGGELLARLTTRWVDGWVSYTVSRSSRVDGPGEEERPFSFDQTHVLSIVAGVDLTHGWRFSSRFRYSTGNPFTPLGAGYFDAGADAFVPVETGARLSERVEDFFQLDLRIDKTWVFDSWRLVTYLELNNATNRTNVEQVGYNFDYTERRDIESLPIVPSFGVRGSF